MVKEYEKILETILATKTGSLSVSDPDLGITPGRCNPAASTKA